MRHLSTLQRQFYIAKCRLHVLLRNSAEEILKFLAKHGFIVEHKRNYVNFLDNSEPFPAPDIKSDRYLFSVSYIARKVDTVREYWFETKKGKRIFTVWDERFRETHISFRADLQSFFAHFSPKQRLWVHRHSPRVIVQSENTYHPVPSNPNHVEQIFYKEHYCDFSDCRYAFEFRHALPLDSDKSSEVIEQSYKAFSNGMMSKVTEINKTLTGVDYDGEMMSPDKTPLSENLICRKCGLPVFASAKRKYEFWCLKHGELEYPDVQRVDPIMYKDVLDNTMEILEDLIQNFATTECPQDSNL